MNLHLLGGLLFSLFSFNNFCMENNGYDQEIDFLSDDEVDEKIKTMGLIISENIDWESLAMFSPEPFDTQLHDEDQALTSPEATEVIVKNKKNKKDKRAEKAEIIERIGFDFFERAPSPPHKEMFSCEFCKTAYARDIITDHLKTHYKRIIKCIATFTPGKDSSTTIMERVSPKTGSIYRICTKHKLPTEVTFDGGVLIFKNICSTCNP